LESTATLADGVAFRIRDYRPSDFQRLWEIDQRCFPPGISYTQMELSGFITRRNAITLVAERPRNDAAQPDATAAETDERNEGLVGFVVAHPVRRKYGRILTLDILPEARRCGLGTKLMTACEERLRSLGCTDVYLETAVNNNSALALYRKLGYQILRTLPQYYASHSLDAFQMAKQL
jgi:[ribosomal protein S18]-alanine N-acetyltransferase